MSITYTASSRPPTVVSDILSLLHPMGLTHRVVHIGVETVILGVNPLIAL